MSKFLLKEYKEEIKSFVAKWRVETKRHVLNQMFGISTDTWGRIKVDKISIDTYLSKEEQKELTQVIHDEVFEALKNVNLTKAFKEKTHKLVNKTFDRDISKIMETYMDRFITSDPKAIEIMDKIKELQKEIYHALLDVERLQAEQELEELVTLRKRTLSVLDINVLE